MSVRVAVVVLNWNAWKETIECLESLQGLLHDSYAVVVVDNASSDESVDKLREWIACRNNIISGTDLIEHYVGGNLPIGLQHRHFYLVCADSNGGYAKGNNLGLKCALINGAQKVWILNNDTVVFPDALTELERIVDSDESIGICGSLLRYQSRPDIIQAAGGVRYSLLRAKGLQLHNGESISEVDFDRLRDSDISYISGASMLVKADFIRSVGYIEERYFLYYEELDWAYRARRKWRLTVAPRSHVLHKVGGSIGTGERSRLSQYYLMRAMILFYRFNLPFLLPVAVFRALIECTARIKRRSWGGLEVTLWGLIDGLKGNTGIVNERRSL